VVVYFYVVEDPAGDSTALVMARLQQRASSGSLPQFLPGFLRYEPQPDVDSDSDGVDNAVDHFPLDPLETSDTDLDGIGDRADSDDDGDGYADEDDAFPLDVSEHVDTDGDGIGDETDVDDDGDSVLDSADLYPLDSRRARAPSDEPASDDDAASVAGTGLTVAESIAVGLLSLLVLGGIVVACYCYPQYKEMKGLALEVASNSSVGSNRNVAAMALGRGPPLGGGNGSPFPYAVESLGGSAKAAPKGEYDVDFSFASSPGGMTTEDNPLAYAAAARQKTPSPPPVSRRPTSNRDVPVMPQPPIEPNGYASTIIGNAAGDGGSIIGNTSGAAPADRPPATAPRPSPRPAAAGAAAAPSLSQSSLRTRGPALSPASTAAGEASLGLFADRISPVKPKEMPPAAPPRLSLSQPGRAPWPDMSPAPPKLQSRLASADRVPLDATSTPLSKFRAAAAANNSPGATPRPAGRPDPFAHLRASSASSARATKSSSRAAASAQVAARPSAFDA
jgi:hypothetical protein